MGDEQIQTLLSLTVQFTDNGLANDQSNTSIVAQAARAALFVYCDSRLLLTIDKAGRYENITLTPDDGVVTSTITLRYFQEALLGNNDDSRRRSVRVSQIVFQSSVGVGVGIVSCPPGTFADLLRFPSALCYARCVCMCAEM